MFVGDGDVEFGCLLLEELFRLVTELFEDVCETDALLAVGGNVVKDAARRTHGAGSERCAGFLARGAESADFGGVGGALSEQAVVGAQSFAATRDAFSAPRDGKALLFGGFCEFGGLLFSLGGFFGGFLGGFPFSLGGFFGGGLFSLGGSLEGFLVSIFGGSLFSLAGFFGGFPFSLFGGLEGFALGRALGVLTFLTALPSASSSTTLVLGVLEAAATCFSRANAMGVDSSSAKI